MLFQHPKIQTLHRHDDGGDDHDNHSRNAHRVHDDGGARGNRNARRDRGGARGNRRARRDRAGAHDDVRDNRNRNLHHGDGDHDDGDDARASFLQAHAQENENAQSHQESAFRRAYPNRL